MAPNVSITTHEDLFLEVIPTEGLHDLCGIKFVGKSRIKTFLASLGNFEKKPSHPEIFASCYTYGAETYYTSSQSAVSWFKPLGAEVISLKKHLIFF